MMQTTITKDVKPIDYAVSVYNNSELLVTKLTGSNDNVKAHSISQQLRKLHPGTCVHIRPIYQFV